MISKINIGGTKMAIQDKFNKPNVIYKITKDIDLAGETLTIPEGCTLDFQGGSFSNGTIIGNDTRIKAGLEKIFNYIILEKTFVCDFNIRWFAKSGEDISSIFENLLSITKNGGKIIINKGTYQISASYDYKTPSIIASVEIEGESGAVLRNITDYCITVLNTGKFTQTISPSIRFSNIEFDCTNGGGIKSSMGRLLTIQKCTFINYTTHAVYLDSFAVSTISNNNFENGNANSTAIYLCNGSGDNIINNNFIRGGYFGINMVDNGGNRIYGNIIYSCTYCINMETSTANYGGIIVTNNELESNNSGNAIKIEAKNNNLYHTGDIISNNYFIIKDTTTIYANQVKCLNIVNNFFSFIHSLSTVTKLIDIVNADAVIINNNTFSQLQTNAIAISVDSIKNSKIYKNHSTVLYGNSTFLQIGVSERMIIDGNSVNDDSAGAYLLKVTTPGVRNIYTNNISQNSRKEYNRGYYDIVQDSNTITCRTPTIKNATHENPFILDQDGTNKIYLWCVYNTLYVNTKLPASLKDGNAIVGVLSQGTSAERPNLQSYDVSHMYFDKTLNKPIWWVGNRWVDATGIAV